MKDRPLFLCIVLALCLLAGSGSAADESATQGPSGAGSWPDMTIHMMVHAVAEDEAAYILAEKLAEHLSAQAEGRYAIVGSAKSRRVRSEDLSLKRKIKDLCSRDKDCAEFRNQVHQAFATCQKNKTGCETIEPRLALLAKAQKRVYAPLVASGKLAQSAQGCLSDESCLQDLMEGVQASHVLAISWRTSKDEITVSAKVLDVRNARLAGSCKLKGSRADLEDLARKIAEDLKL